MSKKKQVYPAGVVVKRSSTGLGLFASQPFNKGDRIIEYIGRTLSN